jgi:hypothetical protein
VSLETIYLSFFIQGRGALRRQLAQSRRTGRAYRDRRQYATPPAPSRRDHSGVRTVPGFRCHHDPGRADREAQTGKRRR